MVMDKEMRRLRNKSKGNGWVVEVLENSGEKMIGEVEEERRGERERSKERQLSQTPY